MTDEKARLAQFLRKKELCITHMENHRIYFQDGDRYEKVLFHHCDLHGPVNNVSFISCVFWGCLYFVNDREVPNLIEATGADNKSIEISDEDRKRVINAEGFRVL